MGEVVPAAVPVKFKRRRVSAVRDFPQGCGPNAVRISLKPPEETLPPESADSNTVKVSKTEEASKAGSSLGQEESVGSVIVLKLEPEEPAAVEMRDLGNSRVEVDQGSKGLGFPEPVVKLEPLELSLGSPELILGSKAVDGEHRSHSKMYGPPKRRRISAVRAFPVGCGSDAPRISREEHPEVSAASSTQKEGLNEAKKAEGSEQPIERGDIKQLVLGGSVVVTSAEMVEGQAKRDDGKQSQEKVQEMSSEAQVVCASKSGEEVNRKASVKPVSDSSKAKSLDGEEKPMVKQQPLLEGSVKVVSAEKSEDAVKSDDGKEILEKDQEMSSEAPVKSSSKNVLNQNVAKKHSDKKILARSTSEKKLERHDMLQATQNIQHKKILLDAKPQSGSKVMVKEGRNLMWKPGDKGSVNRQKDSKILKRKLSEEIEDEGRIVDYKSPGNESLEAYGDRLIVQALMSAKNCPWRKGKKFSGISSNSVTPKNKAMKGAKSLIKKFSSKGSSASQFKSEVDVDDKEDSVPEDNENEKALTVYKGSLTQEDGNKKALTIYERPHDTKRSHDFSVTVIPSVPSKLNHKGAHDGDISTRTKVKKALRLFQTICRKLLQGEEAKSKQFGKGGRIDLQAASILKENNEWVNSGKPILGDVPGVEVGDEFHYRVELAIIGLHRPFQGGIDYMKKGGKVFATSIVASGGYPDDMDSSDVLIYSGSGGNPVAGDKQPGDQKLERGNLALKNSIDARTPVRVIHGFKEKGSESHDAKGKIVSTFTYDGLYIVERYWQERGPHGYNVFKFQLRRMPGQPELALQEAKKSKKSKVREGLCSKDISQGKEIMPICAVNTADNEQLMPFKYITKPIYPSWYVRVPPRGCDCTDGCSDSEKCACAVKNGGDIPFNFSGSIVQAKPLVYECGPSCKCPPSCYNRVSQHGMKIPLEIFKTKSRGWGVRSLYSIPSGSFICEYVGELLQDTEAEQRSKDEYLFDIGHNYDDLSLWEGLPTLIPELKSSSACQTVENVGFTIDAAEYGNIGRFINHSCSPNLYAQNVLYDHDDRRMPHIMFFAADNIPPLQELTYHYNYTIDQVRDPDGNIKRKECFCGSSECTGRLY